MKKLLLSLSLLLALFTGKSQVINPSFCQTNGAVNAVAIDSVNNVVYIGGSFSQVCGQPRNKLAAMNLTTGVLLPWNPGANQPVYSMHVYKNALYVGGFFTTIGGQSRNYAAKFSLPSGNITSWNPAITVGQYVQAIASYQNKIYLGGNFLLTISTGNNLCELDTGTAAATSWNDYPNNTVYDLSVHGGQLYVGGQFTQVGSTTINYLAKYYLSPGSPATLSTTWLPAPDLDVTALVAVSGRLFVGGSFSYFNGVDNRERFAEVDTATGLVTGWNPIGDGPPFDLEYRNGMIYAVGNFGIVGGKLRNFVVCIDATTGIVSRWNVVSNTSTWDASTTNSYIFLGGSYSSLLGQTRNNFAAVCINPIDTISTGPDGPTNVCGGVPSVTYSVAPVPGATSYVWSYSGTGVVVNGTGNTVSLDFSAANGSTGGGDLTVYATNGCETSNTMTLSISVYDFVANISGNTSITCGDSTQLQATDNYMGSGTLNTTWTPTTALSSSNTPNTTCGAKNTITYNYDIISSEGCRTATTVTITVNPININLTSYMNGNIQCSTIDTLTATNDYPGAGTLTYTWSPSGSLNFVSPDKAVASPVVSTNYTVTASTSDGCAATPQNIYLNVVPIYITATSSSPVTCGNPGQLNASTDYPGTGTVTYTWSPAADVSNPNISSPSITPTVSSTYTIDITTPEGCLSSNTVFVTVDPLSVTTAGSHTITCGQTIPLSTSNNCSIIPSYSWSPATGLGSTTASGPLCNVGTTTIYTVTISVPGCAPAEAYDTVKVSPRPVPNICEVTSDSMSLYNILYWDKTPYTAGDTFIVYRETTTNMYTRIGAVPYDSLSQFTDTSRSIGPANGDPNVGTYRYKLAVKDSCGNMSALSPYHNSVYFIDLQTGTFTWNLYAVENATTPVSQFNLLRDNLNNGVWIIIGTVAGTQTTLNDPQYSTHQNLANWRVEALGFNCASTAREGNNNVMGAVVKSKSNITNNRQIGIKNISAGSFSVYPNPTSGSFSIEFANSTEKTQVKILSLLGEEIMSAVASEKLNVDLSNCAPGIYLVQVTGTAGTVTKRIIKN